MYKVIDGVVYYGTTEVCRMVGISRRTLFRWMENGIIEDVDKRDWNGYRLFDNQYITKAKKLVDERRNKNFNKFGRMENEVKNCDL